MEATARGGWRWAAILFLLAPLVGEFLLGNLSITWLPVLLVLAPLYGGGAVLIREIARRLGLGWPGIVLLGLAYATVEEALVTQSLFNPDFVGLRLLDYGYVAGLGMGGWWTVFVLGLHTLWSTATPIAIAEALAGPARRVPWLGRIQLSATAGAFVFGCVATALAQESGLPATQGQLVASLAVVLLIVVAALLAGRGRRGPAVASARRCPRPWAVGCASLTLGSAFMGLALVQEWIPAAANVAGMLAAVAAGATLLASWSRSSGWTPRHELAFAGGLLFTYGWYGFVQAPSVGQVGALTDALGNVVFTSGAVWLFVLAWRRTPALGSPGSLGSERRHRVDA